MYKHSGYRPHKCPICNFAAVDKGTITKHLRVHTGDLPFSCKTCGKSSLLENYARLSEMHYSDFASKTIPNSFYFNHKIYGFLYFTGKQFTQQSGLARHKRIHLGIKVRV